VGRLMLGHYSTRYHSVEAFREEAETVFPRVLLASEGEVYEI